MATEPPLDRAASALREMILAGEQYRQAAARYLGLTISESQAVSYLFIRGPMRQSDLGQALGFNTSSTTALVDRLERNLMAERVPDPTDRRRSTVQLSPAGRRAVSDTTSWVTRAFDGFDQAKLSELATALHTLAADLRAQTTAIPTYSGSAQPTPRRRR